jgi:hypothetical protein
MLPFEEEHSIDAARLESCRGAFAYEEVETGEVRYAPACLWYPYRNPILEKISKKYGVVNKKGELKTCGTAAADAEAAAQDADSSQPEPVATAGE